MDVIKSLLFVALCGLLTACPGSSSSSGTTNKASGNSSACTSQAIANEKIVRWKNGKISRIVFKKTGENLDRFLEKHTGEIAMVEDNFRIQRPVTPETFELKSLARPAINWGVDMIRAKDLWDKNVYGDGVVVAIVDSGIDRDHPQLKNQIYSNPKEIENGLDDDGNGLVDDIHGYDFVANSKDLFDTTGHGTHVAGIIAADHVNGPMRGLAPNAKLLVYDFFGPEGEGSIFDSIKALRAAASVGAKVINASWGGAGCSLTLKGVIQELARQDILFVAAAGNGNSQGVGENIDVIPTYPASFVVENIMAIGAMSSDEYTAGFSNYGKKVALVAPGMGIISTYPGGNYLSMDGTSMATPFVVGAAALLRSAFPQAKATEIKDAMIATVKEGPYPVASRGSLDVSAAYDYLNNKFSNPLR
jgi:subtilisin family serine protease